MHLRALPPMSPLTPAQLLAARAQAAARLVQQVGIPAPPAPPAEQPPAAPAANVNIPGGATLQPTYTTGANPRAKSTPANNTYATLRSSNKHNDRYGEDRYPTVIYSRTATTGDWKLVLTVYGEHRIFYNGTALNQYFPYGFSMDILNGRLRSYVYDQFISRGWTVKTNDKGTQYLNGGADNLIPVWIMGAWEWGGGKLIYYFDNFNPATNTSTRRGDGGWHWDVGYEEDRQNDNKQTRWVKDTQGKMVDTIEFNDADGSLLTYSSQSPTKEVTNIWGPTYLYGRATGNWDCFNMPRTAPLYSADWQYRLSLNTSIVPDANGKGFAPNLIIQKYEPRTPTLGGSLGDPYTKTIWMTNNCNSGNNLDPVGFTSNQQYLARSYAINFRGGAELCIINNLVGPTVGDRRGDIKWESRYIWTNMKNPKPGNVANYVVCYMQGDGNLCAYDYYSTTNYWCSDTSESTAKSPAPITLDPRYSLQLAKKYTLDRFIFVNNDNYVGELYFDKGTSPEFPSTTNCTVRMRKDLEAIGWRFSYITQILDGSFLMIGLNNKIYKAPVGPTIRYVSEHGFIKDGAGADKAMISINQIQDGRFVAVEPGGKWLWVSTGNNLSDRFNIIAPFGEPLFDIKQLIDMTWLVTIEMKNYTEWDVTGAPNVKYSFLLPATFGIPVTVATGKCITNYIVSQQYKNNLVSPLYILSADGTSYSRIVTTFGESIFGGLVNIDYGNTTSLPSYYQIPGGTTFKFIIPAYNGYKLCLNNINNIGMLHVGNNLANDYSNIEYSKVSTSGPNYSSSTAKLLGTNVPVPPPPVGTFVGVGGDGNLYTVSSLLSTVEQPGMWVPTGKGAGIVYVVQLNDKTFACVNSGGIIYTSPSVDVNDGWTQSPTPARLDSLINLKDNTFAGIGKDTFQIYTSPSITNINNWSGQNNTTPLVRLTQLNDGTFAGIVKDSLTVSTSPIITGGGTWTPTNSPANLVNLIQLMDGSFAGVGTDSYVYKCNDKTLSSSNVWTKIPGSCCVKCIIQIKF